MVTKKTCNSGKVLNAVHRKLRVLNQGVQLQFHVHMFNLHLSVMFQRLLTQWGKGTC